MVSPRIQRIVTKCVSAICCHAHYLKAKEIAERNFLAKKASGRFSGILNDCPDIGQVTADFVEKRNIGADAWRRTGVLTFNRNNSWQESCISENQGSSPNRLQLQILVWICC